MLSELPEPVKVTPSAMTDLRKIGAERDDGRNEIDAEEGDGRIAIDAEKKKPTGGVKLVQNEMTEFVQSDKKRTSKSRAEAKDPLSGRREGNRIEMLRVDEVMAQWEETEKNWVEL